MNADRGPGQLERVTNAMPSEAAVEVLDVALYLVAALPLSGLVAVNLACCFLYMPRRPATQEAMVGTDAFCGNEHGSRAAPVQDSGGVQRALGTTDAGGIIVTTASGKCWHSSVTCPHVRSLAKGAIKRFRPCKDCTGSL